ncbi:hypothetical protein, partial [uncultured Porphyromonas sp.]|uniref:hypothetical protein n=1 Tax=uncultured Porphyromonas sp. TaxID=159274 RepID=UPI002632161A
SVRCIKAYSIVVLTGTDAQTERPYSGLLVKSVPTAGYSSRASLQRATRQERRCCGLLVRFSMVVVRIS